MGKITTTYKGDMLFEGTIGAHKVLSDVPGPWGGQDRAPTPPELFIASLGSCVAAFVAHYCEQAGLDSEGLTVDVTFDKVPDPTRLENIAVVVNLPNADISKRRNALLRVCEHCVVHETVCRISDTDDVTTTVMGAS